MGCGYSEAYLGQNLEPFYQRDKAAGLIGPEEATYLLKLLFIKLNEIGYYYGEKVAIQNSADLGQSITLGGFTEDGEDATAEMDYLILDAAKYLRLPQPPLSCCYTNKISGKFLEKVLDVIDTGIGMPQFVNGDVMVKRALNLFGELQEGRHARKGKAYLRRRLRGKLHPLRDRAPRGRATQPREGPRADAEQRLRSPHQGADRTQDRRSRDLQGLRGAVRGVREAAPVLRGHPPQGGVDREHPVCRIPARHLALHPDRGLHRNRHRGLERRGQLLHGRPDRRRWRRRGQRAVWP